MLFVTLAAASFLLVKAMYLWAALVAPLLLYQMVQFFRFQKKTHEEVNQCTAPDSGS